MRRSLQTQIDLQPTHSTCTRKSDPENIKQALQEVNEPKRVGLPGLVFAAFSCTSAYFYKFAENAKTFPILTNKQSSTNALTRKSLSRYASR